LQNLFVVGVGDNWPACGTEDYCVAVQLADIGQVLIRAGNQEWLTPGQARVGPFYHEPAVVLAELAASRLPQQLPKNLGIPVAHGPQRPATFAVPESRLIVTTHSLTVWVEFDLPKAARDLAANGQGSRDGSEDMHRAW
jgi:hypothetical protein